MDSFWSDLRFAWRSLARNPGFSIPALVTLGLGIGLNVAVFSGVNALVVRPLPFEDPDGLVHVWSTNERQGWNRMYTAPLDYRDWQEQSQAFEEIGAFVSRELNLADEEEPVPVGVARCTPSIFSILGATPARGRTIDDDDELTEQAVAVISHRLWQRRYGGRSDVLGTTINLHERPYEVVGVMPERFVFPTPTTDIWLPLHLQPDELIRDFALLQVVGRVADGQSLALAQQELAAVAARLADAYPDTNENRGVNVVPLRQALVFGWERIQLISLVLALAVLFVLLIVAANVANLMLARATARAREVSMRAAMGASRGRLLRQFVTESLLLALLGGALGLLLAQWVIVLAAPTVPDNVYRVGNLGLDLAALGAALVLSLLTAVIVGVVPTLYAIRSDLAGSLRESTAAVGGGRKLRRRFNALVVAQIALAVALLAGAGLMLESFRELQRVDTGVRGERVLSVKLTLPKAKYDEPETLNAFFDGVFERLRSIPGIDAAAAVNFLPLNHETRWRELHIASLPPAGEEERRSAIEIIASPDYFDVLSVPVVRGRAFVPRDDLDGAKVAIINQTLAERYWSGRDPIGDRISVGARGEDNEWHTIVGVVADFKHTEVDDPAYSQVFLPFFQSPWSYARIVVRTAIDPVALVPQIRQGIWSVDAALPLTEVRTLQAVRVDSLVVQRLVSVMLAGMALGALLLAAVGLYGVMAYSVSQRSREIGVRLALGAEQVNVVGMVVRQGLRLTLIGLAIGVLAAIGLAIAMSRLLYGVGAADPLILTVVAATMAAVATTASLVPAWRASRIDPAMSLHYE